MRGGGGDAGGGASLWTRGTPIASGFVVGASGGACDPGRDPCVGRGSGRENGRVGGFCLVIESGGAVCRSGTHRQDSGLELGRLDLHAENRGLLHWLSIAGDGAGLHYGRLLLDSSSVAGAGCHSQEKEAWWSRMWEPVKDS